MYVFKDCYNTVIGQGKSGKSFFTKMTVRGGALYINYIGEVKDFKGWIQVNGKTSKEKLAMLIRRNFKVVFNCSGSKAKAEKEILGLWIFVKWLSKTKMDYTLICDEVHLWKGKLKELAEEIATMGRHKVNTIVFMAQRVAMIPNVLVTQAENLFFFKTKFEDKYFSGTGIPHKEIAKALEGNLYHYIHIDNNGVMSKPLKVA